MVTDGEDNRAGFRASWKLQEAQPEGNDNLCRKYLILVQLLVICHVGYWK